MILTAVFPGWQEPPAPPREPRSKAKVPTVARATGKRKGAPENSFAAAMAEVEKATRAAEAAEAAAKKAKLEADAKLKEAARVEKERLRREATAKKRKAAKIRLLAEKDARAEEASAEEMERMADMMSQQY